MSSFKGMAPSAPIAEAQVVGIAQAEVVGVEAARANSRDPADAIRAVQHMGAPSARES